MTPVDDNFIRFEHGASGAQGVGEIGGSQFYMSKTQYEYWKHTQLIIDVIDGTGGTFSLEGPMGKAFHTRSRLFTREECDALFGPDD